MDDDGLSKSYKSLLFRFLSPLHIFRATSSFASHSAHWDSERGRDGSVGRGCHNFFFDPRAQNKQLEQDGGEEMGWSGSIKDPAK